jgi:hypothetical protein
VAGAQPFGQHGRVVHVLVLYDCVELANDFVGAFDGVVDCGSRGDVAAAAARLIRNCCFQGGDVGVQVIEKIG